MFGIPGETREDAVQTMRMLRRMRRDLSGSKTSRILEVRRDR